MHAETEYWDGNDWEDHVLRLLQDMHGPENIQPVPAKHKGDCGIDYFCVSKSIVYQCYACEEPVSVAMRAEKQRDKITIDIGKFCDPAKGAASVLSPHRIKRWILVVPNHDSRDVVAHSTKKAEEVRKKNLSHVADDFEILVHDRQVFDPQSWTRRSALRARIHATFNAVTQQDVTDFARTDSHLEGNLRRKLSVRISDSADIEEAVIDALRASMESGNAVEALRASAPEAYVHIERLKTERLRRLKLSGGTGNRLDAEIDDLKAKLIEAVPNLDPHLAETVCLGSVSEWLMRCPLRLD